MSAPADWQLPQGVSRGVWDYLHDSSIAERYDESIAGTPLLERDLQFVEKHVSAGGRVLDLGCGTGRTVIPLAKRGCSVVGVDLSAPMLRVCGINAAAAGISVHRLQSNIATLNAVRDGQFDAALCLFSTLGMIATPEARLATLKCANRALRPGGVLVVHGHNRWHHLRTATGRRWLILDVFRSLRRLPAAGDWPMPHAPDRAGWTMHLFTLRELIRLLTAAGFRLRAIEPVGLNSAPSPRRFSSLRAYGFLIAAIRPE